MSKAEPPFRILSLDGGGSWALIQVKALIALYGENARGHEVLRRFDLGISNSGGSIVLACLAADFPLSKILALFENRAARESIFKSIFVGPIDKAIGLGPRYGAEAKLAGLREALKPCGDARMREFCLTNDERQAVRIVICGFDYDRLREVFFRTHPEPADTSPAPVPGQQAIFNATFAEAVHASSNAPVNYFDAPATWGNGVARFWDGAMGGYNNPALAGVVEALRDGQVNRSRVRVLSIGTGQVALPEAGSTTEDGLVLPPRSRGFIASAKAATTCIIDDPPDAASYVAHVVLGGRVPAHAGQVVCDGPLVRMSPLVQPVRGKTGNWDLPEGLDGDAFRALVNLDMDAVADDEVARIAGLADLWLNPRPSDKTVRNQPIRANRWLEVEIGHGTFAEARSWWKRNGDPTVLDPGQSLPQSNASVA
jgi:hypothetical protein